MEDFSHAPETSYGDRNSEVSLVSAALGTSVSFGRFMSESLNWGRFSSFHHNRYMEEVEKSSVPGSVAQKRAYFEAYYRKRAAETAVDEVNLNAHSGHEIDSNDSVFGEELSSEVPTNDGEKVESPLARVGPEPSAENENGPVAEDFDLRDSLSPFEPFKSPNSAEDSENQCQVHSMELNRPEPSDKLPLKEIFITNQRSVDSTDEKKSRIPTYKSPIVHRSSWLPPSPVKSCAKENKSPQTTRSRMSGSNNTKRSSSNSLHISISFARSQNRVRSPSLSKTPSVLEKIRAFNNSCKVPTGYQRPIRPQTSEASQHHPHLLKTPTLSASQFQPHSPQKPGSTASQNQHNPSKTPTSKASQECPQHTPETGSLSEARKSTSATTQSESRRTKPLSQTPSMTIEVDKNLPPSKVSDSASRSRADTWIVSSSLHFRTDERIEKRKELYRNSEDNLDLEEPKKLQFQVKGKVKSEVNKLQQSLCFKAKPMPDFYQINHAAKNEVKKIPLTRPRSPKLGRRVNSKASGAESSSSPYRSSLNCAGSKHYKENSSRAARHDVSSMIRQ